MLLTLKNWEGPVDKDDVVPYPVTPRVHKN